MASKPTSNVDVRPKKTSTVIDETTNMTDAQNTDEISSTKTAVLDEADHPVVHSEPTVHTNEEVFSTFTDRQKRWIITMASIAGFFSPLSSSIYFPALSTIAKDLQVSDAKINLTVTTYLIIQGIAPMIVASISDSAGRRPAYIICFIIYIAANLGLSLQNSYAALMVLRCLQSAGSSGTIALANGVVGDLATSSERGSYIAFASAGTILGPTISPIIGGLLSQYLDWHWLFWFLLILAGAFAIPFLLFFPETCRAIVGNGSVPPPLLDSSLSDILRRRKQTNSGQNAQALGRRKMQIPNPLKSLLAVVDFETVLVLLPAAVSSAVLQAVMTDASKEFTNSYHFNNIQVALMFIPLGVGGIISIFTTGKVVDKNYRRYAKKLGVEIVPNRRQDLTNFPIERARLELTIPLFLLLSAFVIIYGWIMPHHVSLAGPVIVLFVLGYCMIAVYQVLSVVLVDIHPGQAATASALNNLLRCELGAAFAAIISLMIHGIGTGWSYTVMALITIIMIPGLFLTMIHGIRWRKSKAAKQEAKKSTEAYRL